MLIVAVGGAAVLGGLVGVLVPRAAYRLAVPYGEPSRTACEACGAAVSWVGVRGCGRCGGRLGPRTWLTGLSGALSFAALTWALWPAAILPAVLPAVLAVAGLGLLLAPIDLAVRRLPDRLVGTAFGTVAVPLAAAAVGTGQYGALLRAALAGAAMAGGYLLLALLPGGPVGPGDVKLAGVLGLLLGWLGWGYVLLGAALPHLVNGPVALALLLSGRVRRDTALPLGPALLAGAFLAIVVVPAWRRS